MPPQIPHIWLRGWGVPEYIGLLGLVWSNTKYFKSQQLNTQVCKEHHLISQVTRGLVFPNFARISRLFCANLGQGNVLVGEDDYWASWQHSWAEVSPSFQCQIPRDTMGRKNKKTTQNKGITRFGGGGGVFAF